MVLRRIRNRNRRNRNKTFKSVSTHLTPVLMGQMTSTVQQISYRYFIKTWTILPTQRKLFFVREPRTPEPSNDSSTVSKIDELS